MHTFPPIYFNIPEIGVHCIAGGMFEALSAWIQVQFFQRGFVDFCLLVTGTWGHCQSETI